MDPIKKFMKLFKGYELAHGQYRVQKKEADGKMSGRAVTVAEPATEEHFKEHLDGGEYILGIIMSSVLAIVASIGVEKLFIKSESDEGKSKK